MVANLRLEQISYDERTGRYRSEYGGFLSRADVKLILKSERARLETKLGSITQRMLDGKPIEDWERAFANELKNSVIQSTILGAGGESRTTPKQYGLAGKELKRQYRLLDNFAQKVANNELSEKQILARSKMYANSIEISYNQSEKVARKNEGKNEGMRTLSPSANHCRQCPGYATNGYVSIDDIVPVGTNCDCGGNCQCTVVYRFSLKRTLSEMI